MRPNCNRFAFWLPIVMSALAVLVGLSGPDPYAPPGDEGPKAHMFQLLLVLQLPLMATFIATRGRLQWRKILQGLGWQMLGWAAAGTTLYTVLRGQA